MYWAFKASPVAGWGLAEDDARATTHWASLQGTPQPFSSEAAELTGEDCKGKAVTPDLRREPWGSLQSQNPCG